MSRKKLVYTVDDDCRPAVGPDGNLVNAVKEHARNLLSPAIPYFFSTVHDPCVHSTAPCRPAVTLMNCSPSALPGMCGLGSNS